MPELSLAEDLAIGITAAGYDWNKRLLNDDGDIRICILAQDDDRIANGADPYLAPKDESKAIATFDMLRQVRIPAICPIPEDLDIKTADLVQTRHKLYRLQDLLYWLERHQSGPIAIRNFDSLLSWKDTIKLYDWLIEHHDGSVVLTMNTPLLIDNRHSRPDAIYDRQKNGSYIQLSRLTQRELKEAHNLQKLYIADEFNEPYRKERT